MLYLLEYGEEVGYMKLKIIVVFVITIFVFLGFFQPNTVVSKNFKQNESLSSIIFDSNQINDVTVPDCVEIGDIFFMDLNFAEDSIYKVPGPYNEHTAIYIGDNNLIHAGGDENRTICIRNYSRFYNYAKNIAFVRVIKANSSQKQDAVNWSLDQIGKSFQDYFKFPFSIKCHNPDLRWFPKSSEFYCSELAWAAYYNQGIDIDRNGWKFPCRVGIDEIINDDDTEIIYYELDDHIEILKPNKAIFVANKKITDLFNRTLVIGKIDIEVFNAINKTSVVEFYINGKFKGNTTTEPYIWTWDKFGFGRYNIKVVALDENKEILDSYEINVWKLI
jgi:hypothetical protein